MRDRSVSARRFVRSFARHRESRLRLRSGASVQATARCEPSSKRRCLCSPQHYACSACRPARSLRPNRGPHPPIRNTLARCLIVSPSAVIYPACRAEQASRSSGSGLAKSLPERRRLRLLVEILHEPDELTSIQALTRKRRTVDTYVGSTKL